MMLGSSTKNLALHSSSLIGVGKDKGLYQFHDPLVGQERKKKRFERTTGGVTKTPHLNCLHGACKIFTIFSQ